MLTFGTNPGSNLYGFSWSEGPKPTALTNDGIVSPLNLLSVAASVGDSTRSVHHLHAEIKVETFRMMNFAQCDDNFSLEFGHCTAHLDRC